MVASMSRQEFKSATGATLSAKIAMVLPIEIVLNAQVLSN